VNSIRCGPLELPTDAGQWLSRADLVFYGVDHSGPSYEALVYVDASNEQALGTREISSGYAGSFTVFGHGGCYGDEGHCLPTDRFQDEFDRRPTHPLTPFTKTVIATDAIRGALRAGKLAISVTVVPIVPDGRAPDTACKQQLFEYVRLLSYEG
jgi:hypothetical protein